MGWFSPSARLEIEHDEDCLRIRRVPLKTRGGAILETLFFGLIVSMMIAVGISAWNLRGTIFSISVVIITILTWAAERDTRTTELLVSKARFKPSESRGRLGSAELALEEISDLHYGQGGEDDPIGLYATTGWGSTLLLGGLTKEQTQEAIAAIYKYFPDYYLRFASTGGFLTLFGDDTGPTTLGLNSHL